MMPRGEYKIVRHRDNFAHHWRVPNTQRERERERERERLDPQTEWTEDFLPTVWVLVSLVRQLDAKKSTEDYLHYSFAFCARIMLCKMTENHINKLNKCKNIPKQQNRIWSIDQTQTHKTSSRS